MLMRTYLTLGIAAALYFLPHVNNPVPFFIITVISSMLPSVGLIFSTKRHKVFSAQQSSMLGKAYRSYTFCIPVSVFLAFFYPVIALPFFTGFSVNLFLSTFSKEGIVPYWPINKTSKGTVSHGGSIDSTLFVVFIVLDFAFLLNLFL